jgi:hypothetical protein
MLRWSLKSYSKNAFTLFNLIKRLIINKIVTQEVIYKEMSIWKYMKNLILIMN